MCTCVCLLNILYVPLLYFMEMKNSVHDTIIMITTSTVIAPSAAKMYTKDASKVAPPIQDKRAAST